MALLAEHNLERVILDALRQHIERIAEEESVAAAERVQKRVREGLAKLVLETQRHYDVQRLQGRIVITVRNDHPEQVREVRG